MDNPGNLPSKSAVQALLDVIAPGSTLAAIHPLAGSYSNFTHLVEVDSATGTRTRIVIRRYAESGGHRARKARGEYNTLAWLQDCGVPVPEPLYLDEQGTVLGSPGIVTAYVPGTQVLSPSHPESWACSLATMLAKIHSVPCDAAAKRFLLDGNSEVVWFLHSGAVPEYMQAHPDGAQVWQAVHDLWPHIQPVAPALVHIDYWPGNILWDGERISAVVDWEEAAFGDPGIDVAYCRMELFLSGMGQAADAFLKAYEAELGGPVANLGFWGLAAAARPMFAPASWRINEPQISQRFMQFITDARRRAGFGKNDE
jgi:aminoglycoside phosphotransferase (APT) family kinase protein